MICFLAEKAAADDKRVKERRNGKDPLISI
jgi:hypothetical protein